MPSRDSDPIPKVWDPLPPHTPLPTVPDPPETGEGALTDPKHSKDCLAPPAAPVTKAELEDEELEEGEIKETPPTSPHPPPPSIDIQDGEILPTPPTPQHFLIPSIEVDDEEIPSILLTTAYATLQPNPSHRTAIEDEGRYVRSANPSPESLERRPQVNVHVNGKPNLKRKRHSPQSGSGLPQPKKQKASTEQKKTKRFCWELGQQFTGFVSPIDGADALDIATNILTFPIPTNVFKRLVYFCDASMRSLCGAVGVVWAGDFTSTEWEGKGFPYPMDIKSTAILELYGISCALEMAIRDIEKPRANVDRKQPQDNLFFQSHLNQTRSHLHGMNKEVFIFTDDVYALKRIDGTLSYPPNGDMSSQLAAISRHSKTLGDLGVHVELHLSPGHSGIPGNEAADQMAKSALNRHQRQRKKYQPAKNQMEKTSAGPGSHAS